MSLTEERSVRGAEPIGIDDIEAGAHLGVTGDILDMEDGPEIVPLGDPSPLECQKRGVLEGHHSETGHEDIVEPDRWIAPAHVLNAFKASVQDT